MNTHSGRMWRLVMAATLLLAPRGLVPGDTALHAQKAPKPVAKPVITPTTSPSETAPPPNVIVLVVNDLGWQDLSVPLYRDTTAANRRYRTPGMEALAAAGVTFTEAYAAAPVGTPSRVALLTGRAPVASGVTNSVGRRETDTSSAAFRSPAWNFNGLTALSKSPRAFAGPLLPRLLRAAGYHTVHVGLTEWSAAGAPGSDAKSIGFDESMPGARRADVLTTDAIRAMNAARALKQPFFLYLAYDAVRLPSEGDARFAVAVADAVADAVAERALDTRDALYASLIAGVDQSVKDITRYLDDGGIAGQTIVMLLSDNGGLATSARGGLRALQNAPLKGGMGSAYEGGLRVPLIVRWPGVARAGLRSATPVMLDDLFPTILRAARVPNAAQYTRGVGARDLTGTLDNSSPLPPDRPLLWHYPHSADLPGVGLPAVAVEPFSALRVGPWKLIYFYAGSRYELYNLASDLGESRELSLKNMDVAARLSDLLHRTLESSHAQMPIDAAYGRPITLPARLLLPGPPPPF